MNKRTNKEDFVSNKFSPSTITTTSDTFKEISHSREMNASSREELLLELQDLRRLTVILRDQLRDLTFKLL